MPILFHVPSSQIDQPGGSEYWEYNDTFTGEDGDPVNNTKWVSAGSQPATIENNAYKQQTNDYTRIYSRFYLSGNFDIQVKYELTPVNQNSWNLYWGFFVDSTDYVYENFNYASGGDIWTEYSSWDSDTGAGNGTTYHGHTALQGIWRITRWNDSNIMIRNITGGTVVKQLTNFHTGDGRVQFNAWPASTPNVICYFYEFEVLSADNIYYP